MILDYQRTGFYNPHLWIVKNKHSLIVPHTIYFYCHGEGVVSLSTHERGSWWITQYFYPHTHQHIWCCVISRRWFRSSASSKRDPELFQIRNLFRADKALKMSKTNLRPRMHPAATRFFPRSAEAAIKKGWDTIWIWYTNNCDGCFEINDQY